MRLDGSSLDRYLAVAPSSGKNGHPSEQAGLMSAPRRERIPLDNLSSEGLTSSSACTPC